MSCKLGDHPSPEKLPEFGLGLLDPEQTAAIESHVASCDSCCEALQSVVDDSLVSRLRDAVSTAGHGLAVSETPTLASPNPDVGVAEAPRALPAELASHPRYRIEKLLGAGGMGAVYRAYHRVMERPVALKIISQSLTTKPGMVERFAREAKAAARLSHPNIVTAFDAEEAGGTHFLVMEHVEGTDLSRYVRECGPLPVDRACDYVRQAALGLQHAFEQGMVHRDVKPHNLMLTPDGRVKILDFGLARLASEAVSEEAVTATGMVLGTVDYVAPEQAYNAHHADIRSDIYSLGCTLYYLLAGKPPFPVGSPLQKMMAHAKKAPTPLAEFRQDIPEKLIPVLERMMAKNPTRRYQKPAEVALALEQFTTATAVASAPKSGLSAETADHGRTVVIETTPVRGRRRRKFVIVTAILLIAVTGLLTLRF